MEKLFIGIDTGTQGVRVGICNGDGNVRARSEKKWDTSFPRVGWAEQEPRVWWDKISAAVRECALQLTEQERMSIEACCVCATSSTAVVVDHRGEPMMNALMWMDARSKKEMKKINHLNHEVLNYCGHEVSFEWLIPKILWIKNNKPQIYAKSYKIVEQLDWINFKLCGVWSGSICNASCKWNYVKEKNGFVSEYFQEIGLPDYEDKMLMDIKKIGEDLGPIRPELAEEWGINPDIRIVEGGIDAHIALFGMNAIGKRKMGIIMGTSFVHLSQVEEKPNIGGIWGPYDSAIMDGMWLLEGGQISAAGLVNWFKSNFHIPEKEGNPYEVLIEAAKEITPGAEGVTVLDFFQGNRTPYKNADAKGVIYGLNIKHTWKHIYRAVLEAVAFGTRNIIDNQCEQGYDIDLITACGGVTKDKNWMQIISNVTGKRLAVDEERQAGVLGCCVVAASKGRCYKTFQEAADAMVRVKEYYEPDPEVVELYQEPYAKYLALYQSLKAMMSE